MGGDGDDYIFGSIGIAKQEILLGGDGDDHIYGYGGDDLLAGNQGDDRLFGGDGNDILYGEMEEKKEGAITSGRATTICMAAAA